MVRYRPTVRGHPMRLWPKSLKWRTILLTLLGLGGSATVAYLLNRTAVDGWVTGVQKQIQAAEIRQDRLGISKNSPHAPIRDLGNGLFRRGSSADEWFAKHPPARRRQHDEYVAATYEEGGLTVIARDGRLVFARSTLCEYFGFASEADDEAYQESHARWLQEYFSARAAVVGVAPDAIALRPWHYLPPASR